MVVLTLFGMAFRGAAECQGIMAEVLRDYQKEMLDRLYQAWEACRSVMVQMPTGTGKTHLMAEVIRKFVTTEGGKRVLVVAHRRELIEQIRETLRRFGIDGTAAGAV